MVVLGECIHLWGENHYKGFTVILGSSLIRFNGITLNLQISVEVLKKNLSNEEMQKCIRAEIKPTLAAERTTIYIIVLHVKPQINYFKLADWLKKTFKKYKNTTRTFVSKLSSQHKPLINRSHDRNSKHSDGQTWRRGLTEVQTGHQNGDKEGLKGLWTWHDAGLNIFQKPLTHWNVLVRQGYRDRSEKQKISSCVDKMSPEGSEDNGRVGEDRKATGAQIMTRCHRGLQSVSERTTALKQTDSSSRRPHQVPLPVG